MTLFDGSTIGRERDAKRAGGHRKAAWLMEGSETSGGVGVWPPVNGPE